MQYKKLTGAMVRLATTAANGTFVNELVTVAVVFRTWTNAVAPKFSPPPEQVLKPKWSMNDCWPLVSRVTLPFADNKISE